MPVGKKFILAGGWMKLPQTETLYAKIKEETGKEEFSIRELARFAVWKLLELAGFSVYGIYHDEGFADMIDLMHVAHKEKILSATLILSSIVGNRMAIKIIGNPEAIILISEILELRDKKTECDCDRYWCSYKEE